MKALIILNKLSPRAWMLPGLGQKKFSCIRASIHVDIMVIKTQFGELYQNSNCDAYNSLSTVSDAV